MEDLEESVTATGELVFPDDASDSGKAYRLRERSVYEADEVQERLDGDVPRYGKWLPVEIEARSGNEEGFLVAPSQLRSRLVEDDVRTGEPFIIETMTKDGHKESDPYRVELSHPERKADAETRNAALTDD
jgi:hypothetical protein